MGENYSHRTTAGLFIQKRKAAFINEFSGNTKAILPYHKYAPKFTINMIQNLALRGSERPWVRFQAPQNQTEERSVNFLQKVM